MVQDLPFGRYLLTGRLGAGGMAELYVARQTGLGGFDREVVLKLIRPELYEVPDVTSMLLDEARIIAEINHPNVVQVYEVGEEEGILYIAMEYLRGATILQLAVQLHRRGELLPPDLSAALMSQALSGLHAAHELHDRDGSPLHVVHRDVSPSNLICSREGVVKVIDFGVARAEGRLQGTVVGQIKGKLAYMAPEQVRELAVDRRADIFSAAVVLWELCTGKRLFYRDNDLATIVAVTEGQVPRPRDLRPDLPGELDALLVSALALDPDRRPPTAAVFAEALDQIVRDAGRFVSPSAIARYLGEHGVSLSGPAPRALSTSPLPLVGASPVRRAASDLTPPPGEATDVTPPPPLADLTTRTAALLEPRTAAKEDDLTHVEPPAPGERLLLRTRAGRSVVLQGLELSPAHARDPVGLPLGELPGLLPAPLLGSLRSGGLAIEVDRAFPAPGDRPPGIYHDAHLPSTRRETFLIAATAHADRFDLGHRRTRVQTVHYVSAAAEGAARLRADLPALHLSIEVRAGAGAAAPSHLVVLHTDDPATGTTHALCVTIY